MGVLTGVVWQGLVNVLSPTLATLQGIKWSALNIGHYIAIGVLGFNIGNFRRRNKISAEIEEQIAFIAQMRKDGKITEAQAKLQYLALIKKVVENVQLDAEMNQQIELMQKVAAEKSNR